MNLFKKIFPLPKYLQIPAVGIDISDKSIKYAELEKKCGNELCIKQIGRKNINKGVVKNGEIKDKDTLVEQLRELRLKIKNNNVVASLPEEKAFLKIVELPSMDFSKIRKSLEMQLEELVPFPPKEILFDFEIAPSSSKDHLEVVLSAFPKKIAEEYYLVFEKAGFTTMAFELENQSIFRSLVGPKQKGAVMIMDFGKTRTSFLIGEKGVVEFGSTIPVAGENIDMALAKELGKNIFEAEKIKKSQVVHRDEEKETFGVILQVVSILKDEMQKMLNYWNNHLKKQGLIRSEVEEIIICGGDSNMEGLVDYLSHALKKKVRRGNVWTNITDFENYVPEIEKRESLMYATVLGLALRSFQ
ncbi:MAG: pilus assembly protein PilM [Candidatus Marinimicrobia bacterium]|nr:pilus assembly protein PilM [Candidatus Neomarinimicrobiota bacterium]